MVHCGTPGCVDCDPDTRRYEAAVAAMAILNEAIRQAERANRRPTPARQ